jgi:hypothetical protein
MKIIVPLLILCCVFQINAQDCKTVQLHGFVKDTINKPGLYNLFIINKTVARGVFGKPDGSFSIDVNPGDSIYFSITGYHSIKMRVVADSSCRHEFKAYIDPSEYQKQEVIVRPVKTLSQLREERERLSQVETRMVTGFQSLQSPITALYQEFSRRERTKRKVAELEYQDDIERVVKELLRVYVSYDILTLEEDEFLDFVTFMNLNEQFLKTATDYQLILYIKEKYIYYRKIQSSEDYLYDPSDTEALEEDEEQSDGK